MGTENETPGNGTTLKLLRYAVLALFLNAGATGTFIMWASFYVSKEIHTLTEFIARQEARSLEIELRMSKMELFQARRMIELQAEPKPKGKK